MYTYMCIYPFPPESPFSFPSTRPSPPFLLYMSSQRPAGLPALFSNSPLFTHDSVYMSSHVQLFATPWTIACHAPLSMRIL